MAVVIRLTKTGRKGESKYRIVVKEKRSRRDGKAIEYVGWYEKRENGEKKEVKSDRVAYWLSQGATLSATVAKIVKH